MANTISIDAVLNDKASGQLSGLLSRLNSVNQYNAQVAATQSDFARKLYDMENARIAQTQAQTAALDAQSGSFSRLFTGAADLKAGLDIVGLAINSIGAAFDFAAQQAEKMGATQVSADIAEMNLAFQDLLTAIFNVSIGGNTLIEWFGRAAQAITDTIDVIRAAGIWLDKLTGTITEQEAAMQAAALVQERSTREARAMALKNRETTKTVEQHTMAVNTNRQALEKRVDVAKVATSNEDKQRRAMEERNRKIEEQNRLMEQAAERARKLRDLRESAAEAVRKGDARALAGIRTQMADEGFSPNAVMSGYGGGAPAKARGTTVNVYLDGEPIRNVARKEVVGGMRPATATGARGFAR